MSDTVIRVENISKLYRLGEVGTGSLAHDVNRWWHKVRGKEDPYLKIGEVNDRTKAVSSVERPESSAKKRNLTTEDTTERLGKSEEEQTKFGPKGEGVGTTESKSTEGAAGVNQRSDSAEFLEGHSQAGLQMDSEKLASIRSATDSRASGDRSTLDPGLSTPSSSALDSGRSSLDSPKAPPSDWVYALKDVSFEVKRGEVLGIIGRNGAGKSTLLKILSRVTTQSSGQIKVKGRIASLLEVGTGFHPELTGRENIFLNGAILGMRKAEIARKFDEIVEFSGCARYIDTPVKRYSSGMYVRLAFAVAAHLEPEILIVDEVLAVGDAEFQKKCLGKMKDVAGHGRTILFVSHNMAAMRNLCDRVVYMENGSIVADGKTDPVIEKYLESTLVTEAKASSMTCKIKDQDFQLLTARLIDENGKEKDVFECDETVGLEMRVLVRKPVPALYGYLAIMNPEGIIVLEGDSVDAGQNILDGLREGEHTIRLSIPKRSLGPGGYYLYMGFASSQADKHTVDDPEKHLFFTLNDHGTRRGNTRNGFFSMLLKWQIQD
ncbi:MAG: ABC transporter ATP-binding protein [Proteobacteria bacterium]|nr:ABC transporter ATP-binding protein [Pseudomonadota bacterium]